VRFILLPARAQAPVAINTCFLETNNWDDFGFKTLFSLYYRDHSGTIRYIGDVKIGQANLDPETSRPGVPTEFDQLGSDFFSLGQDDSYYQRLNELDYEAAEEILESLNDVAFDLNLFDRALGHRVTGISLLRNVSWTTVRNQFHRIALGGVRLSPFSFSYVYPAEGRHTIDRPRLSFSVVPESYPPTNVHVIIGRNGVGKSRLLNNITSVLLSQVSNSATAGHIEFETDASAESVAPAGAPAGNPQFANLVSVAFSAFDDFEPLSMPRDRSKGLYYTYIGLKKIARSETEEFGGLKDSSALATEFGLSVKVCLQRSRLSRWQRALEVLESDPIFADAQVADLAAAPNDEALRVRARDVFRRLSSGHKIVLLTVTRLVESVEERTLVLIDEPEAHLHPPLLSAFVRALSGLLINRNGVAIIATHSPVVLQEVPRECVWRLRRSGNAVAAERPQIETFGENVGTLTHEVFGLEVTDSGFHRMIADAVSVHDSYDEVLAAFAGSIGSEGRALVQALLAARDADDEDGRS
jgi:predicted ATPase